MKYKKDDYNVFNYDDSNKCTGDDKGCFRVVYSALSLIANVKVMPIIYIKEKEIEAKCVSPLYFSECKKQQIKEECEFCIIQDLTLKIPVHFDEETEIDEIGIICHSEEHGYDDYDDEKQ